MQKPCTHGLQNKKAMKSFDFTASTLDIPSRWDPRAKQSRTVALLAALCAAALFEPFHRADKKKNHFIRQRLDDIGSIDRTPKIKSWRILL